MRILFCSQVSRSMSQAVTRKLAAVVSLVMLSLIFAASMSSAAVKPYAEISLTEMNSVNAAPACINIYYDQSNEANYWMGKTYATLLQNLLGHSPQYQQVVSPIEYYQKGDIERCHASLYIGSYFNNLIPQDFYNDFAATTKQVAWLGYNIWNFQPAQLSRMFGYQYLGLSKFDNDELDAAHQPTFFKNILYKGETFYKYGKYSKDDPKLFLAGFEMVELNPIDLSRTSVTDLPKNPSQILAVAQHNGNGESYPYIIQNQNRFFIADVPFSFMHEADRYLVFADVLFDILQEKPRRHEHLAFVRMEDVHPLIPIPSLEAMTNALKSEQVPVHISIIPIFFDPLNEFTRGSNQEMVPLTRVPEFMQFIGTMKRDRAGMIWHGSTHQLGEVRNPFSAVSGDDFEFWDAKHNSILAQDSSDFVLDRLEAGYFELQKANIYPHFWLTPHYQASPLDYYVFAHTMPWNVGRIIYFNHEAELPAQAIPDDQLWFNEKNTGAVVAAKRQAYFRQFNVKITDPHWSGQIFPYEIYGDVYGQHVIPEDLGNSQPIANEFVTQPRTTEQILADAKRNMVLRDSWGSFFYHPLLLRVQADGGEGRYPGDASELTKLIQGMKACGYKFIELEQFATQNSNIVRPPPIYIQKRGDAR